MARLRLKPSSHVKDADYDPSSNRLTLVLNNGTFAVHDVSPSEAAEYEAAPSHGDHFFANFHGGKKEVTRVR